MKTPALTTRAIGFWLALGLVAACEDPFVPLGPENNVRVTNNPGFFRMQADNMDNVIDDTSFTWVATASQARLTHNSLIPHGEGDIIVHDALDSLVYSGILDYGKDSLTYLGPGKGNPGPWTIEIILKGATGKIDITLKSPP